MHKKTKPARTNSCNLQIISGKQSFAGKAGCISRRQFLGIAGMGILSLPMAGCPSPDISKPPKPNVLFIAIDDLNGWVGCLGGHPQMRTPNLDRLAERGVLFTNAHCAAPACQPSRAALLTGIRPATSGIYTLKQRFRKSPVLKRAVTLPQHFRKHGYEVIGAGKIFHGPDPDPKSWDQYWPSKRSTQPNNPKPPNIPVNGIPQTAHFDWGPVDAPVEAMGDWKLADWVIEQLNKKHHKPIFLGCGFFRPHLPWYVPRKYFDRFELDKIILPPVNETDLDDIPQVGKVMANRKNDHRKVIKYNQWRKAVQGYLASVNFIDECLGRVIQGLDSSPYRDNTIIVLWSDQGFHLGEKLHWRKYDLWQEATHVPMIFVAPQVAKPSGRCDEPVNLIDIYPTLIELCGLSKKQQLEGISLLPQLKDPQAERNTPSLTTHERKNHSLRSKRFRYIRYADGTEELYDHDKDPREWDNLAGKPAYDEIKAAMAKYLPEFDAMPVENTM